ncbi:MAG: phosphopentomutase [Anaerosolibacter sp.]|jgi:phosphopentomutase|uniref:phosphopentomutase n=1 Tax=Anaerosolibacter sp. TaxID=1872527 RepID=UPI0026368D26|nr:phosphopentomutase [Anaerosolibacter sp.]MDF2546439.1 phosphopentomutase [Anaerosolibacter sp.]
MINRVTIVVLDSLGIGALPDSPEYGDYNVDTLGNISKVCQGIHLPNLIRLGLGNIEGIKGVESIQEPIGCFGKANEVSKGKDTITGHWEMTGLYITEPFQTYPDGFPLEIIRCFEEKIGKKSLGNKAASGTEIIEALGQEHIETGCPIVYTSADSVFQIAAHEEIVPLDELYKMCEIARNLLVGEHQVARVIARPFAGQPGSFERTANRRDYSISPNGTTILDILANHNMEVYAIGKIEDIFNGQGITKAIHTKDNMEGVDETIKALRENSKGIIFTNLVDFDAKYGHRRNPQGYKIALEEFDKRVPELIEALHEDDIIIFTADHGNDPTYSGTDHTREYIPIVIYGQAVKKSINIGTRDSFADIAATIADIFQVKGLQYGISFKDLIF